MRGSFPGGGGFKLLEMNWIIIFGVGVMAAATAIAYYGSIILHILEAVHYGFTARTPPIIERVYRHEKLVSVFEFIDEPEMMSYGGPTVFGHPNVILDHDHKQHVMRDMAREMGQAMLTGGFIKIKESRCPDRPPWAKRIEFTAIVYKPEIWKL